MHLSDFSDLILRLTRSAVELPPREHQAHLIKMLSGLTEFDASWWGWSNFAAGRTTLVNTGTFNLPRTFESAVRAVSGLDPFIRHGRRLEVFAKSIEADAPGLEPEFRSFMSAFGLGAIMNGHCRLRGETEFNFFMSLYRPVGAPGFTAGETADFRMILRHLEQSLSLSLRAELRALAPADGEAALLSNNGVIARATRGFRNRVEAEHPLAAKREAILVQLAGAERIWTGQRITLASQRYSPGLMLVRLTPADLTSRLTPEERKVCDLLMTGKTMRQIADLKGVSLNTVRNQVAAIYRKIGVSGKLELAQKLGFQRVVDL